MNARKRKKAAREFIWRVLCVSELGDGYAPSCGHENGYGCRAQDRHERRVLGASRYRWMTETAEVDALVSQNQPPRLWMDDGDRLHRRYRNRRGRR